MSLGDHYLYTAELFWSDFSGGVIKVVQAFELSDDTVSKSIEVNLVIEMLSQMGES